MLKGTFAHRVAVCCPVCKLDDFRVTRRLHGAVGRLVKRCICQRCGSTFEFEEDRAGKAVKSATR